ncbi:type VI secretion system-associated FHA domain protein TagH [Roseospira marina]|nr:type VI secretion system-associated FHA domain protein TagH [Roseospira marina]MBB4312918.1 type VI secretion system FHA domain protein [Roseospira marina]MBB5086309.1 type VI secretion system FHA domain protein [Roseospira marina]
MAATLSLVLVTAPTGGSPRGDTRVLDTGALTIGRGPDNDWILADPERHLSKQHCEIAYTGDAFVVTDTSTNGVYINGADRPVGRGDTMVLHQGDVLRLGDYELRVAIEDDVARDDVVDYQRNAAPWPEFEDKTYYGAGSQPEPSGLDDDADGGRWGGAGGSGAGALGGLSPFDDDLSDWNNDPIRPAAKPRPPATPSDHIPSERDSMPIQRVSHQRRPQTLSEDWDDELEALLGDAPLQGNGGSGGQSGRESQTSESAPPPTPPTPVGTPDDLDTLLGDEPLDAELRRSAREPGRRTPEPGPDTKDDPFGDDGEATPAGPPRRAQREAPSAPTPAPSPSSAPPSSASAPRSGRASAGDAEALVAAFLRGAGLAGRPGGQAPEVLMETAGALLAVMTDGVRDLLAARATLKSEMRAEQTMIRARGNNALKFSVSAQEALERLLSPPAGAYMDGRAAAEEAFRDLRGHEIATMAGSSAAIRAVLSAFDPAALEGKLEGRSGIGGLLSGGRRARLWELYEAHYRDLADEAAEDFDSRFNREFRKAYEKLVKDL